MLDTVATRLRLSPEELKRESLRVFLRRQLRLVESELFRLAHKYGVRTVADLDTLVQQGQAHEADAFEDFFEFDHLEAERDAIVASLREVS